MRQRFTGKSLESATYALRIWGSEQWHLEDCANIVLTAIVLAPTALDAYRPYDNTPRTPTLLHVAILSITAILSLTATLSVMHIGLTTTRPVLQHHPCCNPISITATPFWAQGGRKRQKFQTDILRCIPKKAGQIRKRDRTQRPVPKLMNRK